jgi:hypothetical protein
MHLGRRQERVDFGNTKLRAFTTKGTKLHEGKTDNSFVSFVVIALCLLHYHIDFAVLLYYLDSDWAGVAFQEEADAGILGVQIADR